MYFHGLEGLCLPGDSDGLVWGRDQFCCPTTKF